jgi:AraC-like DNA-binding protein
MKPLVENLTNDPPGSFRLKYSELPFFDSPWHYHAHYELFYIIKGEGRRIIGDNISGFSGGDMLFLGSNLPHVWRNNHDEVPVSKNNQSVNAICLQFREDAFCPDFFDLPEMVDIRKMLSRSSRGIRITGKTRDIVAEKLLRMLNNDPFTKFISLLEILEIVSLSEDTELLTSVPFYYLYYHPARERMGRVFEFIANNYRRDISLEEVARYAGMSKSGFCRHFRTTTLKTFIQYLNEVKVSYACKLLVEDKLSISEIAYESGFHSISYFNRTFKIITGLQPGLYKTRKTLTQNNEI